MYLPTLSASLLVCALTWLWTLKPVCLQRRIFSTMGRPMSFFRSSRKKTSWVKNAAILIGEKNKKIFKKDLKKSER